MDKNQQLIVSRSMQGAVTFLLKKSPQQLSKSFGFSDEACSKKTKELEITLSLSLAAQALARVDKFFKPQKKQLIDAIEKEAKDGSFNYWMRKSPDYEKYPLPDDLDDTVFALCAIKMLGEEVHNKFLLKLTQIESKPGGPYRTWYLPEKRKYPKEWYDIDPGVNANLFYLLGLLEIDLPDVTDYVQKKIRLGNYKSIYYPYDLTTLFYTARGAGVSKNQELIKLIPDKLKKYKWEKLKPLEKIFFILANLHCGQEVKQEFISEIIGWQNKNMSFPAMAFCFEFSVEGKKVYAGSEVITTSLVIEMLSMLLPDPDIEKEKIKIQALKELCMPAIIKIQKELKINGLQKYIEKYFEKGEGDKAVFLPFLLAKDLKKNLARSDIEILSDFSCSIYFGWLGYTLVDELVDGQQKIEALPPALQLIDLHRKYSQLCFDKNLWEDYEESSRTMLENYALEAERKINFKNYDYIEKRMKAYLQIISSLPFALKMTEAKSKSNAIYKIMRAQVIIDQFNDDAHDWEEDLKTGTDTYTTGLVVAQAKKQKTKDLATVFWSNTINEVISLCKKEYKDIEPELKKLNSPFLQGFISKTMQPILKAEKEVEETQELLGYYAKN